MFDLIRFLFQNGKIRRVIIMPRFNRLSSTVFDSTSSTANSTNTSASSSTTSVVNSQVQALAATQVRLLQRAKLAAAISRSSRRVPHLPAAAPLPPQRHLDLLHPQRLKLRRLSLLQLQAQRPLSPQRLNPLRARLYKARQEPIAFKAA